MSIQNMKLQIQSLQELIRKKQDAAHKAKKGKQSQKSKTKSDSSTQNKKTCAAVTTLHRQCRHFATPGYEFCRRHNKQDANANTPQLVNPRKRHHCETEECTDIVNFDNELSDANANRVEFVNPKKRQHSETEECTDIVNDDNEFSEADSLD